MAPTGKIAQSYDMFYLGASRPSYQDVLEEVVVVYPGYKPLFYQTAGCSSWQQLCEHMKNNDLRIHRVTTEVEESLTWDEFEAKWLHPSQVQLRRDPLKDRRLEGWYDDMDYAFCHRNQDDHVPPTYKLSRVERDQRAEDDLDTVRAHQAERKARRLQAINEMAERRQRGRAGRRAAKAAAAERD